MRHFIVAADSYIADRLLAAGSRITDAWLNGATPGSNLIETDEAGVPLDPKDGARLLAAGVHLGPVQVAPVAPHAPNPTRPQSIPGQSGGSVMIAGDRGFVPGDGVESNEAADARVERLKTELAAAVEAAEAARSVADEPEAPQRRGSDTGGEPSPLDGSIADLTKSLASIDDTAELQRLRQQEVGGKSRTGALEAIDARFAELQA
jgi:hypothetical protein